MHMRICMRMRTIFENRRWQDLELRHPTLTGGHDYCGRLPGYRSTNPLLKTHPVPTNLITILLLRIRQNVRALNCSDEFERQCACIYRDRYRTEGLRPGVKRSTVAQYIYIYIRAREINNMIPRRGRPLYTYMHVYVFSSSVYSGLIY
jgi:hypothetical protein